MVPSRSLLLVNYHAAALARRAVDSARAASSVPLQIVVVDNSTSSQESDRLRESGPDRLIAADHNLGYAGGINRGLRFCEGELVLICNPDVVFHAASIDLLAEALRGRIAMTGPRFCWDDGARWLLPPAEMATAGGKLSQALATRWSAWRRRRDVSRFRRRVRFWLLQAPARVRAISGAVMCVRRSALDAVGGFDERFPLYFEEIDLMRRLSQRGEEILYVPAASCRHLYNQSAAQDPAAPSTFEESERLYHRKWSGAWLPRTVARISRALNSSGGFQAVSPSDALSIPTPVASYLVEASPLNHFEVATGHFPSGPITGVPAEVWSAYRNKSLFLRVIHRESGKVAARYRLDKTD